MATLLNKFSTVVNGVITGLDKLVFSGRGITYIPSTNERKETLAAPENMGRAVGSPGNENTAIYLSEIYKKIGLQPLIKDSYEWPYTQILSVIDIAAPEVVLYFKEGITRTLQLGSEINVVFGQGSTNIRLGLTCDINDSEIKDKIFLCVDDLGTREYYKKMFSH